MIFSRKFFCFIIVFITSNLVLRAQNEVFEKYIFKADTIEMPYRLLKPANYNPQKKYPILIFLHGAGERGTENEIPVKHIATAVLNPANRTQNPCFVLVPQCNKGFRWVEVPWNTDAHEQPEKISVYLNATIKLLDSLQKSLPIDTNRIYLTGISMGGFGVWDWATRQPERFACIVPVCGGADDTKAEKLKNLPIWAFHGALDRTVKTIRTQNIIKAIKILGGKPLYTEYPNIEHTSWKPAYQTPQLWKWIFSQKKEK